MLVPRKPRKTGEKLAFSEGIMLTGGVAERPIASVLKEKLSHSLADRMSKQKRRKSFTIRLL